MEKNPPTVLAINPGTRYTGIAVLKGSDLLDWGVKVANGKWSQRKLEKVKSRVSELIEEYQMDVLAMKKLHPSRTSPFLRELCREIQELAENKHLRVCRYSVQELEDFCAPKRTTKKALAEAVCFKYPVLSRELRKEEAAVNTYHIRMFEAVALGMTVTESSKHVVSR